MRTCSSVNETLSIRTGHGHSGRHENATFVGQGQIPGTGHTGVHKLCVALPVEQGIFIKK